jgi:hypothetical protein
VIHRDVKPLNLVVSADGQVKVIDFGLARRESDPTITPANAILGTLHYLAPEIGDPAHEADRRADLYSLGCTLYHLLAGHPPFAHIHPDRLVNAHRTLQPPKIEQVRPEVPRPVAEIVRRLMAKHIEDRFQTAAEVAEALAPVSAALRTEPRRFEVSAPGAWLARPKHESRANWRPVASRPATVTLRPQEEYYLLVRTDATEAQLAGLNRLKGLAELHSLSLTSCERLTDDVLAHVAGQTGLRNLYLSSCERLTDDGLAHLQGLTGLQILDLSFCREATNAGLAHLRGLTALQSLDLSGCARLDKAGLSHLAGFTALQNLNLSRCELVTDEVLECLAGLGSLERLWLNRTRVTDAGLAHLHRLASLRVLSLTGCTRLTDAGLERLASALPGCEICAG